MALQIRRGTSAQRTSITPATGELIYTTDTKLVYVGDGSTAGGNIISGGGGGLTDIVNDTSPQLGGNLDVNGRSIVSASNGNITIAPNGTGRLFINSSITRTSGNLNIAPLAGLVVIGDQPNGLDGNLYVVRETYSSTPGVGFVFAQHHNTAEAVNFSFYRTRGTAAAQTTVQNNDRLANIVFSASDGTQAVGGAIIQATVDGAVSSGRIPSKFNFVLHDGLVSGVAGLKNRLQILSSGLVKFDTIGELTAANGINVSSNLQLNGQNDLRFADADSSNWVAFQAPSTVSANVTWTLPGIDGTAGQALTTNGSGTLTWTTVGGGGGVLASRTSQTASTGNIADLANADIVLTAFKTFALLKIQTSHAAWVRLYTDTASRSADSGRAEGVDPSPGAGVIAEVITSGAQTVLMSPAVLGFNNEGVVANAVYAAVKNKSGATANITVTLTMVQLEN